MIAGQKLDSLAALAEGEVGEEIVGPSENEMVEMAAYVNSRHQIIAALAMLLAVSALTNMILLTTR
jgi:serine/threonine-protein kinase